MKTMCVKYILLGLFIICINGLYGQSKCNIDVDSLFQTHFLSIDTTIKCDTVKKFVKPDDAKFIMLIGFMSGIDFEMHSYTGQPQVTFNKLIEYKTWYINNRKKIKCEAVKQGILLLETDMITEETINKLEELKIE